MFPPSNGRPHYGFTLLPLCLLFFLPLPLPLLLPNLLFLPLLLPRLPKPMKAGFKPPNLANPLKQPHLQALLTHPPSYLLPKIHNTKIRRGDSNPGPKSSPSDRRPPSKRVSARMPACMHARTFVLSLLPFYPFYLKNKTPK
jgi:hypothetical protein